MFSYKGLYNMGANKKVFRMNQKERKRDSLETIIFLVMCLIFIIFCRKYAPNVLIFAIICCLGAIIIYGRLKLEGLWVEIEDGFVRVYKRRNLKFEFYKDNLDFRVEKFEYNVKLVLWSQNQKVEINRVVIGERAFKELVCELVELTNIVNTIDFTNGKSNSIESECYVKFEDKNKTIIGTLKNGLVTFIKIFIVGYIILMLIVVGIIFAVDDGNYMVTSICGLGVILIILIVFGRIKSVRKKRITRYIDDNEKIGFLHIEHKGFIKNKRVEITELNGNRELDLLEDIGVKPRKVFFINEGLYEAVVLYVEEQMFFDGSSTTTKTASQIIKFEIEANKYYVLKYNKELKQYSFYKEELPKSLEDIVNIIETKKYECKGF